MFNDSDNGQTQYCPMCEENSRFTGLYDTCSEKIYYGDIVHWTDGGDDLSLEERIKTRWDRIAIVERLVYQGKERPEIIFRVIDSPSDKVKSWLHTDMYCFNYGGFIYKDTENYLTKVAESIEKYKNKFDNAGQCMAYVLEKRGVKC